MQFLLKTGRTRLVIGPISQTTAVGLRLTIDCILQVAELEIIVVLDPTYMAQMLKLLTE